jgi:hypothetical protein
VRRAEEEQEQAEAEDTIAEARAKTSTQPTCLSLPLEKGEGVSLADGALDVPDDGSLGVVDELHAYLGHVTG